MVSVPRPRGVALVLEKVGARLRQFYGNRFALVEPVLHTDTERQVLLIALQCLEAARTAPSETERLNVVGQVEKALRKNPLIGQFLDQGFWSAHHVDIVIRHNGQDHRYEADWIKDIWYVVRRRGLSVTEAVRAEQRGYMGGSAAGGGTMDDADRSPDFGGRTITLDKGTAEKLEEYRLELEKELGCSISYRLAIAIAVFRAKGGK